MPVTKSFTSGEKRRSSSSYFPLISKSDTYNGSGHPTGAPIVCSKMDERLVHLSSLMVISAVIWVPSLVLLVYRKWKSIPREEKRKRSLYRNLLIAVIIIIVFGPHRHPRVGKWLNVRKWKLWESWLRYISFEVISEHVDDLRMNGSTNFDRKEDQAILAIVPHGIVPFSLAFAALPQAAIEVFGKFRPVVASATRLFPLGRTLMEWMGGIDATKSSVNRALSQGHRIVLCPGGISEMFEGYPKSGRHPDDECVILNSRKGFVKMALRHKVPIIPVFTFGASKMFRRLQSPIFEKISNLLRISFCLFYGEYGLPIPIRKKLLYVVGKTIHPPAPLLRSDLPPTEDSVEFQKQVDDIHEQFCDEIRNLFEKYKHQYGWGNKTLRIV